MNRDNFKKIIFLSFFILNIFCSSSVFSKENDQNIETEHTVYYIKSALKWGSLILVSGMCSYLSYQLKKYALVSEYGENPSMDDLYWKWITTI